MNEQDLKNLLEAPIAHRGLHDESAPENSLAAFKKAIDAGYSIEFDVQQLADGTLVAFHDEALSRMTGNDGYIKFLKNSDLEFLRLAGTDQKIPTLEEILSLVDGKVFLLIEVKNRGKVGKLEESVIDALKHYNGKFAIQSFNPYTLEFFYKHAPQIPRGQLSGSNKMLKAESDLPYAFRIALSHMMLNKKVSHPDFINYEAKALPNRFVRKYKDLPLLAWVVTNQEEYMKVVKLCDNVVFEDFDPKI